MNKFKKFMKLCIKTDRNPRLVQVHVIRVKNVKMHLRQKKIPRPVSVYLRKSLQTGLVNVKQLKAGRHSEKRNYVLVVPVKNKRIGVVTKKVLITKTNIILHYVIEPQVIIQ